MAMPGAAITFLVGELGRNKACTGDCETMCFPFEGYAKREMECGNRRNTTREQTYQYWKQLSDNSELIAW